MTHSIPEQGLSDLGHFIADKLGLHFPSEKWSDLERGIKGVSHLYHFKDPIKCIEWLKSNPLTQAEIERIASYFTIGETYFFRESGSMQALEKFILPSLIEAGNNKGRTLRIWSAGCSTGEEPYSIAILLSRLLKDISDWNITLIASDINIIALNRLQEGRYSEWSFRTTPVEVKEKYFKKMANNRYEILPYLKKMVTPTYLNLAEDSYPSLLNNTNAMDLILCRNTLMYFEPHHAKRVIEKFSASLIDGGYFLVGASENFQLQSTVFKAINYPDTIIHQKQERLSDKIPAFEYPIPISMPIQIEVESIDTVFLPEILNPECPIIFQEKPEVKEEQPSQANIELMARTLANEGNLKEALVLVEEAIAIDRCNATPHYLKALILQELGQLSEAVLELRKSIYLSPDYILPYFTLANISRAQNKKKEVDRYFSIVSSLLKPYSPEDIIPGSDGMTAGRMMETISWVGKKIGDYND